MTESSAQSSAAEAELLRLLQVMAALRHPENGCPITALNSDNRRQSKKFRAAFEAGVQSLAGGLAGWIKATGHADVPPGSTIICDLADSPRGLQTG